MADLAKLQADVAAQTALIETLVAKVKSLQDQITAHAADQAAIDAVAATVESNNAALTAASA